MNFTTTTPAGGIVHIEVKPAGTRRNTRDEKVKLYKWHCNAFFGQHGDPFGTIEADDIYDAHDVVRAIVRRILQRKHAYEAFHARDS
jgi:hypothetical protein